MCFTVRKEAVFLDADAINGQWSYQAKNHLLLIGYRVYRRLYTINIIEGL